MAVTTASFRAVFPEFADTTKYPDPAVTFWLDQAGVTLPQSVPAGQLDLATMLYIAHNLTLGILSASGSGGAGSFAPVSSKSVGPISKSMDTSAVTSTGAGVWNGTAYGQRLWALLRGFVTGGFYRPSVRAASLAAMANYPYGR
jgi:hypothetical protein